MLDCEITSKRHRKPLLMSDTRITIKANLATWKNFLLLPFLRRYYKAITNKTKLELKLNLESLEDKETILLL